MVAQLLLVLAFQDKPIIVAEALIRPHEPDAALAEQLAQALGAPKPDDAARMISERLPAVPASVRLDPIIEAQRLVEEGRDAYVDGRFAQATERLTRARDVLHRAVESLEEERQAAETLFRAHMYLAFTLRSQGGDQMPSAIEAMKEGIRAFPTLEPSFSEFGPENVRFFRHIK